MSDSNRGERSEALGQGLAILASVILCCTIVAVLTFAWVSYSTDRDERAEYYQAEAQRNSEAICVGREGGLLAECIEEQRRASRDAYTAEQDLNAQRQMALWALWMFIVSACTAGLTLWALWYVRGTLQATREALDDTGNATKAMVEANRIASEAQRPWLTVEVLSAGPWVMSESGHIKLNHTLRIENCGHSPAIYARFAIIQETENLPGGKTNVERFLENAKPTNIALDWFALGPGQGQTVTLPGDIWGDAIWRSSPEGQGRSISPDLMIGVVYQGPDGQIEYYTIDRVMAHSTPVEGNVYKPDGSHRPRRYATIMA